MLLSNRKAPLDAPLHHSLSHLSQSISILQNLD